MYIFKYISTLIFILIIGGCGTSSNNFSEESPTLFDLYWSSFSANDENETVQHGIYGSETLSLASIAKIISVKNELGPCAVDSEGNLYWSASGIDDNTTISIFSADKYGNNTQELLTNFTLINGLTIDNIQKRIYWSNKGTPVEIAYSDLNGSNPQVINTALTSGGPLYIDTENARLYVSDTLGGQIHKWDMEGVIDINFTDSSTEPTQLGIDYLNKKVIWTDTSTDLISSSDLNGSGTVTLLDFNSSNANPNALVVDRANSRLLYIINGTTLQSAALNGDNNITQAIGLSPDVQSLWFVQ